jgi:hypothetical protein
MTLRNLIGFAGLGVVLAVSVPKFARATTIFEPYWANFAFVVLSLLVWSGAYFAVRRSFVRATAGGQKFALGGALMLIVAFAFFQLLWLNDFIAKYV